jgi:hypothetical protein
MFTVFPQGLISQHHGDEDDWVDYIKMARC